MFRGGSGGCFIINIEKVGMWKRDLVFMAKILKIQNRSILAVFFMIVNGWSIREGKGGSLGFFLQIVVFEPGGVVSKREQVQITSVGGHQN